MVSKETDVSVEKSMQGETVSVLGLAASGMAVARLVLSKGGSVYASDIKCDPTTTARGDELRALGAEVQIGGHDLEKIAASETVVASPGIPADADVLRALRARGVGWISEPEFAFRFLRGSLIAVTGTNGKTTTAALTAHLLEEAGIHACLGGNIGDAFGPPASELAMSHPDSPWYVLELSSFQLAGVERMSPDIGVVTNLASDHLDRYPDEEAYHADKACLFKNAEPESRWVLQKADAVESLAGDAEGARYHFSSVGDGDFLGAYVEGGVLTLNVGDGPEYLIPVEALPLLGRHNVENALAAALAARLAGADAASLARGLRTAPSLPHRMERLGEVSGILWVNDSKATNVAAARTAIESLDGPLIVLLGGRDKGEDLAPLAGVLPGKAKLAILYGEAADRIAEAIGDRVTVHHVDGLESAVQFAADRAIPRDTILLSPACSSFDMFENYEARGDAFRSLAGFHLRGREGEQA